MTTTMLAKNIKWKRNKKTIGIFLILACVVTYLVEYGCFVRDVRTEDAPMYSDWIEYYYDKEKIHLVNTTQCKIENINPLDEELRPFLYNVEPFHCSDREMLTYITTTNAGGASERATLNINKSVIMEYSSLPLSCCYRIVSRNEMSEDPDTDIIFSECIPFWDTVTIKSDTIKVECTNIFRTVYSNVHFIFIKPKKVNIKENEFNVLMIGIDSISRSNLMRTMPKTFQFCEKNGWTNLKGYNKIDDNTYPNLMALLTGMDYPHSYKLCNPDDINGLIQCDFIWNHFKEYNYSTLYAEDLAEVSTFTYLKKGFLTPPTDYYLRPYFLAINSLSFSEFHCSRPQCRGPERTGSRMLTIIKDFTSTLTNRTRGFGLFWMNSFSHDDINCPRSMDEEMSMFFKDLQKSGALDESIVVFFSDHGFRFGSVILTHTGWVEERLPFIYIWLPEKFREKHKEAYANLLDNAEKLTTPYDLHMTLHHLISLSHPQYHPTQAADCPKCTSLLKPIDPNRTCADAAIPSHWCTCTEYKPIDVNEPLVQKIARKIEREFNEILNESPNRCAQFFLEQVMHARKLVIKEGIEENILLGIKFYPGAAFEVTVKVSYFPTQMDPLPSPKLETLVTTRLDRYEPRSWCVKKSPVQKYCFCQSVLERAVNIFCNNIFCYFYFMCFYLKCRQDR